jgi:hypothetical protein
MSSDDKVWADANEPDAVLIDGDKSIRCLTLGEAIAEWERLPEARQKAASVKASSGRIFTPEISRNSE